MGLEKALQEGFSDMKKCSKYHTRKYHIRKHYCVCEIFKIYLSTYLNHPVRPL